MTAEEASRSPDLTPAWRPLRTSVTTEILNSLFKADPRAAADIVRNCPLNEESVVIQVTGPDNTYGDAPQEKTMETFAQSVCATAQGPLVDMLFERMEAKNIPSLLNIVLRHRDILTLEKIQQHFSETLMDMIDLTNTHEMQNRHQGIHRTEAERAFFLKLVEYMPTKPSKNTATSQVAGRLLKSAIASEKYETAIDLILAYRKKKIAHEPIHILALRHQWYEGAQWFLEQEKQRTSKVLDIFLRETAVELSAMMTPKKRDSRRPEKDEPLNKLALFLLDEDPSPQTVQLLSEHAGKLGPSFQASLHKHHPSSTLAELSSLVHGDDVSFARQRGEAWDNKEDDSAKWLIQYNITSGHFAINWDIVQAFHCMGIKGFEKNALEMADMVPKRERDQEKIDAQRAVLAAAMPSGQSSIKRRL